LLHFLHPLVRLFLIVLILEYFQVFFNLIHLGSFASNGKGIPALDRCADVLEIMARVLFLLLLLLIGKGWTISSQGALTGKKAIVGAVVAFIVSEICIIIWKFAAENPAETSVSVPLQVFEVILTIVWLAFAIYFIVSCVKSFRSEDNPVKKALYRNIGFLYSLWFCGLPVLVFIGFALDPWAREKTVLTLQLLFSTLAYFVMSFLTWHSRASENFDITTPDVSKGGMDYDKL